jgi:hypothetical protein
MTDEPQQGTGDARPKFLNSVTGWIGGLTAVVLALAGLKAAYNQLGSSEEMKDESGQQVEAAADVPPPPQTEAEAQASFPTGYTGTWKNNEVTLEWQNGLWVETTDQGDDPAVVIKYEQLARTDRMTNVINRDDNLYVRWPTDGGTVEKSTDGINWSHYYDIETN